MEIVRHYNNKGVMLSKDGNVVAAIAEYKRALKFFPKFKENFRIHYNIGLACAQMKTPESLKEAEENLTVCLELEPDFEKAKKALETVQKATNKKAG
jgi:tetratricopeptide (TPR) repeat protein